MHENWGRPSLRRLNLEHPGARARGSKPVGPRSPAPSFARPLQQPAAMDLQHLRLPEWLPLDWLPLEGEAKAQAVLVLLALALAAACLVLGRTLSGIASGTARWLRVAVGTRAVPEAPGGLPLLGHALSLATAYCPWEKMLEWARLKGPLTRFSILYRTGLIVNDAAGAKRVFQVRPVGCAVGWRVRGAASIRRACCRCHCNWACCVLCGSLCQPASCAAASSACSRLCAPKLMPFVSALPWHGLQTGQRLYDKDLDFSYKPFLSILGTGLVTANGAHWQKQRLLM